MSWSSPQGTFQTVYRHKNQRDQKKNLGFSNSVQNREYVLSSEYPKVEFFPSEMAALTVLSIWDTISLRLQLQTEKESVEELCLLCFQSSSSSHSCFLRGMCVQIQKVLVPFHPPFSLSIPLTMRGNEDFYFFSFLPSFFLWSRIGLRD